MRALALVFFFASAVWADEPLKVSVVAPLTVKVAGPSRLTEKSSNKFAKWVGCGFSVDWGDKAPVQIPQPGSSCAPTLEHTYRTPGDYVIRAEIFHPGPDDAARIDWKGTTTIRVAAEIGWKEDGKPVTQTEARKSKNGFGGWLVVTSDSDWKEKWETSPSAIPKFTEAHTLNRGQQVFILTFFSNPELDAARGAEVRCDIDVHRPDGSSSVHQTDLECFKGAMPGNPQNVYLTQATIAFTGDAKDPAGEWRVDVALVDKNSGTRLPLKTSFRLAK